MSPVRVSSSQEIAPTLGQCFKRSWGGLYTGGEVCVGVCVTALALLCRGMCWLVHCSFPKSLAFLSASALWATSPPPVSATLTLEAQVCAEIGVLTALLV